MCLSIVRSDVMLDKSVSSLKQVELNTFASGFGHLGPISAAIHRFALYIFIFQWFDVLLNYLQTLNYSFESRGQVG